MAEVVMPGQHGKHSGSMGAMAIPGGPSIEMVPNRDFSFPMQPPAPAMSSPGPVADPSIRPASMHINLPRIQTTENAHKRAASTLPSFSFNSSDNTGLKDKEKTPPQTPDENVPVTPSRRGHRRGGSEFVGGDSRLGVSSVVSSSPTKTNALPLPLPAPGPPPSRRGHAHRRSAAMSSHDVGSIMQPSEVQPRLSSSLPATPLEQPAQTPPLDRSFSAPAGNGDDQDPFGPPLASVDSVSDRPPSRPRVGFSDNVEIIPRPLSTISSETESSMSTVRGHSVNNSISSVLSLSTPSPPASRTPRTSLSTTIEDELKPRARSSAEISKRVEKEGEWLKSRSSNSLKRPLSEPAMAPPKTTFVEPEQPARPRSVLHKKKHSLSHALGFDRRRSEPTIGMNASEASRLSALSLQESMESVQDGLESRGTEQRSSAKKIRAWAASKMSRRPREVNKALSESSSMSSMRPESAGQMSVAGAVPMAEPPIAETDLDAVFGRRGTESDEPRPDTPSQPRIEVSTPTPRNVGGAPDLESDDSPMLDLDAALGPFKTPPIGSYKQRRELHSSRLTRDFNGPGGHYHRRTESAPALSPFETARVGAPSQSSMADVFEEEEEDDSAIMQAGRAGSTHSGQDDEAGVGIQVVDSDNATRGALSNWSFDDGLGIQKGGWEPERPSTSYGNSSIRLSTTGTERRGSSIVEETIMEEASPADGIEIVEDHEEPRSSSLTKSSDSSDTPTVLAAPHSLLTLPDGHQPAMTPDTYQTSTFSSPDFGRRQGSFDTSRLGTSASSITDNRTMSSCMTGDHGQEIRASVDDVPSLTSSRSTMLSTMHANSSRRDFSGDQTPSASSGAPDTTAAAAERRRKHGSIQSLSQLVGGSFGSKSKLDEPRPQTAADSAMLKTPKKKEHRLKKLMFWKSKQHSRQSLQPNS